jgi:transposase
MKTETVKVGVDISKSTFDVALPGAGKKPYVHKRYSNKEAGFEKFLADLPSTAHVVMEASSSYYVKLASFLHHHQIQVSVVNPLVVSHFAKMLLNRVKTDRKDATIIAEYACRENPPIWRPKPEHMTQMQQINTLLDNLVAQRTRLINQLEAFSHGGLSNKILKKTLTAEIKRHNKQIAGLEAEMERLTTQHHRDLFARLKSIPGMGKRSAMMLIVITEGFTRFSSAKQLACYLGLTPRIYQSGQYKGRSRISKMGMSKARSLLYMCAMSAKKYNTKCKEMYERLKMAGKNGKLALIAIAGKLVRQAWAVGTSQNPYIENFHKEKLAF